MKKITRLIGEWFGRLNLYARMRDAERDIDADATEVSLMQNELQDHLHNCEDIIELQQDVAGIREEIAELNKDSERIWSEIHDINEVIYGIKGIEWELQGIRDKIKELIEQN